MNTVQPRTSDGAKMPIRGWFATSSSAFRDELLARARPKFYPPGAFIYRAGDQGDDFFGVASGVVLLQCRFTHPDATLLHVAHPGEWFGSAPVLADQLRQVTAVTRSAVEVLRVPGTDLRELLQQRPEMIKELARNAIHALNLAIQAAADLLIRDAAARCAAVLLRLSDRRWPTGPEAELPQEVPVSQQELAMLANLSRKSVSQVLRLWAEQGLVAVGYRSILVKRPSVLRRVADAS